MVTSAPAALTLEWRLFTVDEYHAMTHAGILHEDDWVELIDGILVKMAAIGLRHLYAVNRLNHLFVQRVQERAMVSVQNPVRLNMHSEPEPDLVLLRPDPTLTPRACRAGGRAALRRGGGLGAGDGSAVKLPLYTAAGIAEVWIVALPED